MERLRVPKCVLLADDKPKRALAIAETLRSKWKACVHTIASPHGAIMPPGQNNFDTTIFTLPFVKEKDYRFMGDADATRIFIANKQNQQEPEDVPNSVVRIYVPDNIRANDRYLIKKLAQLLQRPLSPSSISNAGNLDDVLKLQIQRLDQEGGILETGKQILIDLIAEFLPGKSIAIHKMGQGFSGASVFGVSYSNDRGHKEDRVLKLTPAKEEQDWKWRQELQCFKDIGGIRGGNFIPIMPEVYGITVSGAAQPQPAKKHGWIALMYLLVKDSRFNIADLEKIFLNPESCLPSKGIQNAQGFLDALFAWLLLPLYRTKCSIVLRKLWSTKVASDNKAITFPPYCFRRQEKYAVIESIYSLDYYGKSLFEDDWETYRNTALGCVPTGRKELIKELQGKHAMLRCPVHGDLNASNVFMALELGLPFLIDFACYQAKGHAVQDAARLEVAIKIELMGQEERGKILGKDLNSNHFEKWCAAEEWISKWPGNQGALPGEIDSDSVIYAYKLCWFIRQCTKKLHQELLMTVGQPNGADFELSYNVALLYHTLRAIRYPSLPHLKRIFAVYSVNRIVERIRQKRINK